MAQPQGDLRKRTAQFAVDVIRFTASLPRTETARTLGQQLLRSGTSVGAHYREACRARSSAEFISKLEGGLQELDEISYWIELLAAADLVSGESTQPLHKEADELTRIFVACVKTAKQNR